MSVLLFPTSLRRANLSHKWTKLTRRSNDTFAALHHDNSHDDDNDGDDLVVDSGGSKATESSKIQLVPPSFSFVSPTATNTCAILTAAAKTMSDSNAIYPAGRLAPTIDEDDGIDPDI